MPTRAKNRDIEFAFLDNHLEMRVSFPNEESKDYVHRCTLETYKIVAFTIDENREGITLEELVSKTCLPFTQVNTALSFLKERGCVKTHRRKSIPASDGVYEDAMIEISYLEHVAQ